MQWARIAAMLLVGVVGAGSSASAPPTTPEASGAPSTRARNLVIYVLGPGTRLPAHVSPMHIVDAAGFVVHALWDPDSARQRLAALTRSTRHRDCRPADYRMLIDVPEPGKKSHRHFAMAMDGGIYSVETGTCGRISRARVPDPLPVWRLRTLMPKKGGNVPVPARDIVVYVGGMQTIPGIMGIVGLDFASQAQVRVDVRDPAAKAALVRLTRVTKGSTDKPCGVAPQAQVEIPDPGATGYGRSEVGYGTVYDVDDGTCGKIPPGTTEMLTAIGGVVEMVPG